MYHVNCKEFVVDATKIGNELRFISPADKSNVLFKYELLLMLTET
jgi:hypothetical protein